MINWKNLYEKLSDMNRIVLSTHENPDGDGLGCAYAMHHIAKKMNIESKIITATKFSKQYNFLNQDNCFELYDYDIHYNWIKEADAAFIFDVGDFARLRGVGRALTENKIYTFNIDHHPSLKNSSFNEYIKKLKPFRKKFEKAYKEIDKANRSKLLLDIRNEILSEFDETSDHVLISSLTKDLEADIVRGNILKTKKRIDGRDTSTVRPIVAEVGTLPRAHGSALFTRGETQALVVATLGTGQDEQIIDALEGEYRSKFMLHYNFPPYSVGEAGRFGSPGRREIGHGKLAWRAVNPLLPSDDDFPYTVRIVSEITESNGSSSMATVCGTSLALMDAGVPIKKPVAGIAMGLIKEKKEFSVLSDILGDEDHLGDMDFKVAGTEKGITSLQMDIKITSITQAIMEDALAQANSGRMHILSEMAKSIDTSRDQVSSNAPRITAFKINKDKIREVIGPGGKMIREITENTGAKIDLDDDGTVKVAAVDEKASEAAIKWIKDLTQEPEVGAIYDGKVVKTVDFGAFVNFMGAKDGLVHISELAKERVGKTTDIVNEGDMVKVKLIGIDDRGKIKLSMKALDQKTGKEIAN